MRAEVVVWGEVDELDLWPYATGSESDGLTSRVTLDVHDSRELVVVLRMMAARGVELDGVKLFKRASA